MIKRKNLRVTAENYWYMFSFYSKIINVVEFTLRKFLSNENSQYYHFVVLFILSIFIQVIRYYFYRLLSNLFIPLVSLSNLIFQLMLSEKMFAQLMHIHLENQFHILGISDLI